jgi:aspartate carbamoyltransferase catalytic subunit
METVAVAIPEAAEAPITPRHLLDLTDWSSSEVGTLFETTDVMAQVMSRRIKKVPALQGFTIGTLFFENSTRTRISFERAARAQSADVISFASGNSSMSKGESLKDTLRTIDAMQADLYVVRHRAAGVPHQLTHWTQAAIVNAGDGRRAHPTQALLDAYTFKTCYPGFEGFTGTKLAIVGDVAHSRVARSNIALWTKLGARITLCGPATLVPPEFAQLPGVTRHHRLEEALEGANAVMALRLQHERMTSGLMPSIAEYAARYQVTEEALAVAHPNAIVLHPGPINRDVEISGELADSGRSVIGAQVANGVPVRMAVLYTLLVGRN